LTKLGIMSVCHWKNMAFVRMYHDVLVVTVFVVYHDSQLMHHLPVTLENTLITFLNVWIETSIWNTFCCETYIACYSGDAHVDACGYSWEVRYFCAISTKIVVTWQLCVTFANVKIHECVFNDVQVVTCDQTNGWTGSCFTMCSAGIRTCLKAHDNLYVQQFVF
jgi:hypothetical protein